MPLLNLTAERDRIAPGRERAGRGNVGIPSGHVGMIVGSARGELHARAQRLPRPRLPLTGAAAKSAPTHP